MVRKVHVFILVFVGQVLQQQTEAIAGIGNILKQRCQGHEDHNGRGQGTDRRSKLIV